MNDTTTTLSSVINDKVCVGFGYAKTDEFGNNVTMKSTALWQTTNTHAQKDKRLQRRGGIFHTWACPECQATGGATWRLRSVQVGTDTAKVPMAPKSGCMNAPILKPQHIHSAVIICYFSPSPTVSILIASLVNMSYMVAIGFSVCSVFLGSNGTGFYAYVCSKCSRQK